MILPVEVANVIVTLERRRILSARAAVAASDVLSRLDPVIHPMNISIAALRQLAVRYGLSAYDATYLALAIEPQLPVACGDRPLKAALPRAGVRLA